MDTKLKVLDLICCYVLWKQVEPSGKVCQSWYQEILTKGMVVGYNLAQKKLFSDVMKYPRLEGFFKLLNKKLSIFFSLHNSMSKISPIQY